MTLCDAVGNERSTLADAGGAYALAGLRPGRFRAACRKDGCADARETLDLAAADAPLRHDFVLRAALSLRIVALDEDGRPLTKMLRQPGEPGWAPELYAIATRDLPGAVIPIGRYLVAPRYGVGRFTRQLGEADEDVTGAIGYLRVFAPRPVHVSLVARNAVLATLRLDEGAGGEIVFRVAREAVRAAHVDVTVRVVGPSGQADPTVSAALYEGGGTPAYTNADGNGVVRITDELPGRRTLLLYSRKYRESLRLCLRLNPGERRDLGTVALSRTTRVEGQVLGPDGEEVRCHVRGYPAGTAPSDVPTAMGWTGALNHRGAGFRLWLPQGRFVLLASALRDDDRWGIGPTVVDVGGEPTTGIVIRLRRGTQVTFAPTVDWSDRLTLLVRQADDLALWGVDVDGPDLHRVVLAPGPYVAELHAPDRVVRRLPFEVGDAPILVPIEPE